MNPVRRQNWFLYGPIIFCILVMLAPLAFHLWLAPFRPLSYDSPNGTEAIQLIRLPEHHISELSDPFDAGSYAAAIDRYARLLRDRESLEPFRIDANHYDLAAFWEQSTPPNIRSNYQAIWNAPEGVLMLQGGPAHLARVRKEHGLGPFPALRDGHLGQRIGFFRYHYEPDTPLQKPVRSIQLLGFPAENVTTLAKFTRVSGPDDHGFRRFVEREGQRAANDIILSVSADLAPSGGGYRVDVRLNASIIPTLPSPKRVSIQRSLEFRETSLVQPGDLEAIEVFHDTTHRDLYFALVTIEELLTDEEIADFLEGHRSRD